MKPEYTEDDVYCLIASWAEGCGFEIKYSDRNDQNTDVAHTRPDEYGPSTIQMYNAKALYIPFAEYYGYYGCHDDVAATIGAANILAHEVSRQIFKNVSCIPFAKLFGIEPVSAANGVMVDNEDACDAFGNFLYSLAYRIVNGDKGN